MGKRGFFTTAIGAGWTTYHFERKKK